MISGLDILAPWLEPLDKIGEDRRELFRQNAKANTFRKPMPTDTDDVAYTAEDKAAYLESVKGDRQ